MTETLVGQFPKHIGSTGCLLNSAETEEKYAIVWKSSKEQAFELPTGGAAIMLSLIHICRCRRAI